MDSGESRKRQSYTCFPFSSIFPPKMQLYCHPWLNNPVPISIDSSTLSSSILILTINQVEGVHRCKRRFLLALVKNSPVLTYSLRVLLAVRILMGIFTKISFFTVSQDSIVITDISFVMNHESLVFTLSILLLPLFFIPTSILPVSPPSDNEFPFLFQTQKKEFQEKTIKLSLSTFKQQMASVLQHFF